MHEIKTEKYKGFFPLRLVLFVIALAALVTLVFWQIRITDKKEQLSLLKEQLAVQELKNQELGNTVSSLEGDDGLAQYAEKEAREDLDYAKSGERVFVDAGGGK